MFELITLEPLLHKFTLKETGIEPRDFNDIKHTFDALPEDLYERKMRQVDFLKGQFPEARARLGSFLADYYASDLALASISDLLESLSAQARHTFAQLPSSRRRTIAKFLVEIDSEEKLRLQRVPVGAFSQTYAHGDVPLSLPRVFQESSEELTEEAGFKLLLSTLSKETLNYTNAQSLTIVVHQVTASCTRATPFVLPEGIHQDGADFIVSAIPVVMEDVVIPASTVYAADKVPIFTSHLKLGEGLFHDDRSYWHSVSDLHTSAERGKRGTLGFDIRINS